MTKKIKIVSPFEMANCMLYRLSNKDGYTDPITLEKQFAKYPFKEISEDKSKLFSIKPIEQFGEHQYIYPIYNNRKQFIGFFLNISIQARQVNRQELNKRLDKNILAFRQRMNRKPENEEIKEMGQSIYNELLPISPIKEKITIVFFDLISEMLFIDSRSVPQIEEITAFIRKIKESLPITPIYFKSDISEALNTLFGAANHSQDSMVNLRENRTVIVENKMKFVQLHDADIEQGNHYISTNKITDFNEGMKQKVEDKQLFIKEMALSFYMDKKDVIPFSFTIQLNKNQDRTIALKSIKYNHFASLNSWEATTEQITEATTTGKLVEGTKDTYEKMTLQQEDDAMKQARIEFFERNSKEAHTQLTEMVKYLSDILNGIDK